MLNRELTGRAMSPGDFETSTAQLGSIKSATEEQKKQAVKFLQRNFEHARLPCPAGWEEDILEGWLDLFGLNNRPIRITHKHQSDSVAYPSS